MAAPKQTVALVVEDEGIVRCALIGYLQDEGYRVVEAGTGAAALAILGSAEVVDILVTDIRLGEGVVNGWAVAKAFREKDSAVAVIYVSGNTIEPERMVTGSVFLTKPYDLENILSKCHDLVHVRHLA